MSKEQTPITVEGKRFCKVYTGFYGETIDDPKQLVKHCFDDVGEFIEFCEQYAQAKVLEAKANRSYLGNGKVFWTDGNISKAITPLPDEMNQASEPQDDLPF